MKYRTFLRAALLAVIAVSLVSRTAWARQQVTWLITYAPYCVLLLETSSCDCYTTEAEFNNGYRCFCGTEGGAAICQKIRV
jgi:hypothetical protein